MALPRKRTLDLPFVGIQDGATKSKRQKMDRVSEPRLGSNANPITLNSDDDVVATPRQSSTARIPTAQPQDKADLFQGLGRPTASTLGTAPTHPGDGLPLDAYAPDLWTKKGVLKSVQTVFPDICPKFVKAQYSQRLGEFFGGEPLLTSLINHVSELPEYPRSEKPEQPPKVEPITWGEPPWKARAPMQIPPLYLHHAKVLLVLELPRITLSAINDKLVAEGSLHRVYDHFTDKARQNENLKKQLKSLRRTDSPESAQARATSMAAPAYYGKTLADELEAARSFSRRREDVRRTEQQLVDREARNEAAAVANGQIGECGCCFTDVPVNRMTHCSSAQGDPHRFCYECTRRNADSTIGNGKSVPQCMDISGCKANFEPEQLQLCVKRTTLDLIFKRQQLDEVKQAISDLDDCPFCDFAASCAPIETDREFTCGSSTCGVVSCRLCRHKTHIPFTCQEAAAGREKEKRMDQRHVVEEAMSEALVRTCNRCKNRFIKEDGCNKMRCSKCQNIQCYVCGENTASYAHFGQSKCPLHDDYGVSVRHDDEVKKAEAAAKEKIKAQHGDITEEELTIEVSSAVQEEEDARLIRAKGHGVRGNPADPYAHIRHGHPVPVPRHQIAQVPDAIVMHHDLNAQINRVRNRLQAQRGEAQADLRDQLDRLAEVAHRAPQLRQNGLLARGGLEDRIGLADLRHRLVRILHQIHGEDEMHYRERQGDHRGQLDRALRQRRNALNEQLRQQIRQQMRQQELLLRQQRDNLFQLHNSAQQNVAAPAPAAAQVANLFAPQVQGFFPWHGHWPFANHVLHDPFQYMDADANNNPQ